MARIVDLVEIELDQKRALLINHRALFNAEREINNQRSAKPDEHASIDFLMVDAFNRMFSKTGLFPFDLLIVMIWAGLLHEQPKLTIDQTLTMVELSPMARTELSGVVWTAYFKHAGKNLVKATEGEDKPPPLAELPGSDSKPSHE